MARISKKEIREGLEEIPIEQILLGSTNKRELTHKQKTFAKQVALGKTKAEAYRIAYDTNAKPPVVATEAQRLTNNPNISLLIDAYKASFEAREYRKPERLRELVIHQLTITALDPEVKDAQRIKCLELLGKVSEVGAFTERKETKVIHESAKIKEKLLDQLKTIINVEAKTINADDADELLREISDSRNPNQSEPESENPTTTPPPDNDHAEGGSAIHINMHSESESVMDSENTPLQPTDSEQEKNEVETFPPTKSENDGVGVSNSWEENKSGNIETPPHANWKENG